MDGTPGSNAATARSRRRATSVAILVAALALVVAAVFTIRAVVNQQTESADQKNAAAGAAASRATSMADFGGLDGLVAAAKKEGELNVIALPPDWANYGAMTKAFSDKYGIKVNPLQPDASSQDEINVAKQLAGQSGAPDVFDMGQSVALANTAMFAPYKVATFDDISDSYKDPNGLWVNDYGGYMSIGYDSDKVPLITGVNDLMKPKFKGKVALNGDPTQAGAAFTGVVMVSVSQGGSPDDIAPGVDFFRKLNQAGNFLPVARLWQEFLFSDQGQNLFLQGGVRPVRTGTLLMNGTIDRSAYGILPPVDGAATFVTAEQNAVAAKYLEANWANAVR